MLAHLASLLEGLTNERVLLLALGFFVLAVNAHEAGHLYVARALGLNARRDGYFSVWIDFRATARDLAAARRKVLLTLAAGPAAQALAALPFFWVDPFVAAGLLLLVPYGAIGDAAQFRHVWRLRPPSPENPVDRRVTAPTSEEGH